MANLTKEEIDVLCLKVGKHGLMLTIDLINYMKETDLLKREILVKKISDNVDTMTDVFESKEIQFDCGDNSDKNNLDKWLGGLLYERNKGHLSWWLSHVEYFITDENPNWPNVDLPDYYKNQYEHNKKMDLTEILRELYLSCQSFCDDLDDKLKYFILPKIFYAVPLFCGSNFDLDHLINIIDWHLKALYKKSDFKRFSFVINGYEGGRPLVNTETIVNFVKPLVSWLYKGFFHRDHFYANADSFSEMFGILSLYLSTDKVIEIIKETGASLIYIYDGEINLNKILLTMSPQNLGVLINSNDGLKSVDEKAMLNACVNQAYMAVKASEESFAPADFLKLIIKTSAVICLEKNCLYAIKLFTSLGLKLTAEEKQDLSTSFDEKLETFSEIEDDLSDKIIESLLSFSGYFTEMYETKKIEEILRVKQMCLSLLKELSGNDSKERVPKLINPNCEG